MPSPRKGIRNLLHFNKISFFTLIIIISAMWKQLTLAKVIKKLWQSSENMLLVEIPGHILITPTYEL